MNVGVVLAIEVFPVAVQERCYNSFTQVEVECQRTCSLWGLCARVCLLGLSEVNNNLLCEQSCEAHVSVSHKIQKVLFHKRD